MRDKGTSANGFIVSFKSVPIDLFVFCCHLRQTKSRPGTIPTMAGIFTDKKKRNGSSRYLKYLLDAGRPEEEEETLIQKHNVSLKMNKFFSFVIRSHNRKQ